MNEFFENTKILSGIFDTHSHYTDQKFDGVRKELITALHESGVKGMITCGVDIENSKAELALAKKFPFVYCAVGYHPENIENTEFDEQALTQLLSDEKAVAIGEIGLDYYWDTDKDKQKEFFAQQLQLSKKLDMPVIIHDREAHADTLEFFKKYTPNGVVHCYSGSVETAKEILNLGLYLGFGGVITFKNARKTVEVAEYVPLDRILLETDCPYLAPVPFRGKTCHSGYITYTAQKIAEIKGITTETVINASFQNAKRLFTKLNIN